MFWYICTDCSRDVKAGDYHHLHLSRLPLLQGDLETAQHSQEVLQQVAAYVTLVHGEEIPLAVDFLKQSAAKKKKSVKANVFKLVQYRKQKWRNAQQL